MKCNELNKLLLCIENTIDIYTFSQMRFFLKYIASGFIDDESLDTIVFNIRLRPADYNFDYTDKISKLMSNCHLIEIWSTLNKSMNKSNFLIYNKNAEGIVDQGYMKIDSSQFKLKDNSLTQETKDLLDKYLKPAIQIRKFLIHFSKQNFQFKFCLNNDKKLFGQIFGGRFNYMSKKPDWKDFIQEMYNFIDGLWTEYINEEILSEFEIQYAKDFLEKYKKLIQNYLEEYTSIYDKRTKRNRNFLHLFNDRGGERERARSIKNIFKNFKCILGYLNAENLDQSQIKIIEVDKNKLPKQSMRNLKKEYNLFLGVNEYVSDLLMYMYSNKINNEKLILPNEFLLYDKKGNLLQSNCLTSSLDSNDYPDKNLQQTKVIAKKFLIIKVPELKKIDFKIENPVILSSKIQRDYENQLTKKSNIKRYKDHLYYIRSSSDCEKTVQEVKSLINTINLKLKTNLSTIKNQNNFSDQELTKISETGFLAFFLQKFNKILKEYEDWKINNKLDFYSLAKEHQLFKEKLISQLTHYQLKKL